VKVSQAGEAVRTRRLHDGEEASLLAAALVYEQSGTGNRKLTAEIVEEIRRRVAAGEKQIDVAGDFKISGGLCNQIVKRMIWKPLPSAGTGQHIHDLIIGALDTGARQGQLLKSRTATSTGRRTSSTCPPRKWHDLRREFGSLLYEHSNGNVFFVMQALGHKSLKTTQKYLHLGDHGVDDAFQQVFVTRRAASKKTKKSCTKVAQKCLTKTSSRIK